jgi:hypothetical protein
MKSLTVTSLNMSKSLEYFCLALYVLQIAHPYRPPFRAAQALHVSFHGAVAPGRDVCNPRKSLSESMCMKSTALLLETLDAVSFTQVQGTTTKSPIRKQRRSTGE